MESETTVSTAIRLMRHRTVTFRRREVSWFHTTAANHRGPVSIQAVGALDFRRSHSTLRWHTARLMHDGKQDFSQSPVPSQNRVENVH